MARESIGRMERGGEAVERRTELAARYIAEVKPRCPRTVQNIHDDVTKVLDDVAVRGVPSIERSNSLKSALEDWTEAGGTADMRPLLYRAQGVIGLINVSEQNSPTWLSAMRDLVELRRDWSTTRPDLESS
jgi:hypothetical protein